MAGPGADALAGLPHDERRADLSAGRRRRQRGLRGGRTEAKLRAARDLAASTVGQEPETVETSTTSSAARRTTACRRRPPAPALLARPALRDLPVRHDARRPAANGVNPLEVIDGALTRRVPLGRLAQPDLPLPELGARSRAARGRRQAAALRRAGRLPRLQPEREGQGAGGHARREARRELGADGAIVTTDAGGNSHTDTMLTVRACERTGIRTVALVAEMGGLTDHVPEADASSRSATPRSTCRSGVPNGSSEARSCSTAVRPPTAARSRCRNYLGATCQMGDLDLRAVTW